MTEHWGKSKRNFNIVTKDSQEWYTPKYILDALGPFDLDPCSPMDRPFDTARKHYTKFDDGLCKPWVGRVWLNPPYKDIKTWMRCMAWHGNGIALTFNRLGTHWFDEVVVPYCSALFFLTNRLKFIPGDGGEAGTAPQNSVLIAYDARGEWRNNLVLKTCRLPGNFWDRSAARRTRTFANDGYQGFTKPATEATAQENNVPHPAAGEAQNVVIEGGDQSAPTNPVPAALQNTAEKTDPLTATDD